MTKKTYWKAESFLALDFPAKGDLIVPCSPDLMRETILYPDQSQQGNALQEYIIVRIINITLGDVLPLFNRTTAYQEWTCKSPGQWNMLYLFWGEEGGLLLEGFLGLAWTLKQERFVEENFHNKMMTTYPTSGTATSTIKGSSSESTLVLFKLPSRLKRRHKPKNRRLTFSHLMLWLVE